VAPAVACAGPVLRIAIAGVGAGGMPLRTLRKTQVARCPADRVMPLKLGPERCVPRRLTLRAQSTVDV